MEQIAENTSAVCSVATALFMGYLDSATTIAASHGGGGSPGSGWGKRMTRMTSLSVADALEWLCT